MKSTIVRVALAATFFAGTVGVIAAQQPAPQQQSTINIPAEELKAYQPIEKAPTAAETIALAKDFLAKYPTSAAVPQVEVVVYNKIFDSPEDDARLANTTTFHQMFPASERNVDLDRSLANYYLSKENFGEIERVSEAYIAKHPDDAQSHVLLLQVGVEGAKRGNAELAQSGIEHGKKAIELLEAPTKPSMFASDADWQTYKTGNLSTAYQSMGILSLATGDMKGAADYLAKASVAKPDDPLNYLFLASVKESEYDPLAKEYNSAIDKSSAASKQKLDAINVIVDQLIPIFAKAVVYSEGNAQYANVNQSARQSLESYYKLRHDGKLDGLDAVLAAAKGHQ